MSIHVMLCATVLATASTAFGQMAEVASVTPVDEVSLLRHEVERLRAEVDALKAAQEQPWLTEQRAREIRLLVQDVLSDADLRASLLESPLQAGWDNGFFLTSADGNFRLNIKGYLQARFIYNRQNEAPTDDDRWGFENARTQLFFEGHVIDPSWTYRIQGDFARNGGTFTLLDAWAKKSFDNGWGITAGQFRMPLLREFLVVETTQLAVDRSLVHQEFSGFRTQGVMVDYQSSNFRWSGSFDDGIPAPGGGSNVPWNTLDVEWSVSSRVEWLASGTWQQFADFTSIGGSSTGLMFGGAVHVEKGEFGTLAEEREMLTWTVDGSLEMNGWNAYAAFVGRTIDGVGIDKDQYGLVVQGGLFITETIEPFARIEWGDSDDGSPNLLVLTVGVNKYFARQRLKWTTDIGVGLHEVSAVWGAGELGPGGAAVGWRTDSPGEDSQIVIRSQIQLMF